jgi:hypothetical protein
MIDMTAIRDEAKRLTALTPAQLEEEAVARALLSHAEGEQAAEALVDMDHDFLEAITGGSVV